MKPKTSILNQTFKYTNAASTDIRKTFARVRREQKANAAEVAVKVQPIKKVQG